MKRAAIGLSVVLASGLGWSCSDPDGGAQAIKITNRSQLIGGDRALGDVGDFILQNERVRAVIQGPGYSRGFGVYGGSLIDADLRRPYEEGTSGQPIGNDQFGELFPSLFVQAVNVDRVAVTDDGSSGGSAKIIAQGDAGDFIELAALLNRAVTGSNVDFQSLNSAPTIRYTTTYEAEPHKPYITITFTVENISSNQLKFPSDFSSQLLGLAGLDTTGFKVPCGDIALFGATSSVWIPGIGFDSRFGLEDSYRKTVDFPAFPGVLAEFVASRGNGASYGLAVEGTDDSFVLSNKAIYDDGTTPIDKTTMLVPFSASSFLGIFHAVAPPTLDAHKTFSIKKYFIIGSGDVGSVVDGFNELRGLPTGRLGGQVFDTITGVPSKGTTVVVYQKTQNGNRIYSEYDVREDGSFGGTLLPGKYQARTVADDRQIGPLVDFEIVAGQTSGISLTSVPAGRITVRIVDNEGHPLPAKSSAIGIYAAENSGKLTRQFLFDLEAGEPFRRTDMITDDPNDPETRKYVEAVAYTNNGMATISVRPGHYRVVSTRGPEYDIQQSEVDVGPNETQSVTHALTRVVNTPGWVSGDLHIHSRNSIDSAFDIDTRVTALAAEGVEWAVSTDHNFVTDYRPYVARNNLYPWIHAMVGVEMTTLESGHFNGYPLRYDPGPVTHGAFSWAGRPPDDIWNDLRGLGANGPENTIVQVNHPRDGILGYLSQYNRSSFTGDEEPGSLTSQVLAPKGPAFKNKDGSTTFSWNFDAMEIANGKLFYEIHNFRVPATIPTGDLPAIIPPTGMIVRKSTGDPGFPGAADDWMNFLNTGRTFIGVGTADSHSGDDEAGQFRTWVFVGEGNDNPNGLTDEQLIAALKSRHAEATNAPLIDFYLDDPVKGVMGQTMQTSSDHVTMHYTVTSAPWAGLTRLNFWRNGTIAKVIQVDPARDLAANPIRDQVDLDLAKDASGKPIDSWFTVEALGNVSMFPDVTPQEIPPVLLTEAVATLAGPLGLGSDEFGALRPPEWFPVTPFAMTNPTWVTTHDGPWQPPGVVPEAVIDTPANDPGMFPYIYPQTTVRLPKITHEAKAMSRPVERYEPRGRVPMFYPRRDNPFDVRKALSRFGHLNGHRE